MNGQSDWYEQEGQNFKVIYRQSHAHLVSRILFYAESSLDTLRKVFNYIPSEKIIINTYDASDYGFGATTTSPHNYMRLEIAPMEPGYEVTIFDDRLKWIISHELVHIAVNDNSSNADKFFRSLFCKVVPEKTQPISIFYSLFTNFNRYTPRWYQESIAVFLETWMNGGYGRALGSFDEMYFRSMILENKILPSEIELDTKTSQNSFLLENVFYIYGTRFASYLTLIYGPDKLIQWFKTERGEFYQNFVSKFRKIFNIDMKDAWNNFVSFEKDFQEKNIQRLMTKPLTEIKKLSSETFGWVTQPFLNKSCGRIFFASHRPDQLAQIQMFDLQNGMNEKLSTLPTPSILQVASTAYDDSLNSFFYTTNNNQFYRDVWILDTETKEKKKLFKNCRVGGLTVSQSTHELFGIEHSSGIVFLVYSSYPYSEINRVLQLDFGDEVQQLSISPSGKNITAILHQNNGEQKIILMNVDSLKNMNGIRYEILYESGSPENVSWSNDEQFIFWNDYSSGVSNIYRMNIALHKVEALTNSIRGLFRPLCLSQDSIFAFEFTTKGFVPVLIGNMPAEYVPAINYLGQEVLTKYPHLMDLNLSLENTSADQEAPSEKEYSGLSNLQINSFIPVISGFQSQKILGFYGNISDPLLSHEVSFEIGYSPFKEKHFQSKFHLKLKYEFQKQIEFGLEYNAPEFYDLFNKRKRGMNGTKINLGYNYYWIYDNPFKIFQHTEVTLYKDVDFLNDNLIKVSQPDFLVAQSKLDIKNQRRSIGSSDFEYGNDFTTAFILFSSKQKKTELAYQIWAVFGDFSTWLMPHNIFYLKAAAGYHKPNSELSQSGFFFGGFGNREVEQENPKQYREVFRFPGIPIYSLAADNFVKLMLENNFPPIRFSNLSIGRHYLSYIDFSVFTQGIIVKSDQGKYWANLGGQVNSVQKHWDNLESTFSAGIAKAWFSNRNDWEWFLSLKLLRD